MGKGVVWVNAWKEFDGATRRRCVDAPKGSLGSVRVLGVKRFVDGSSVAQLFTRRTRSTRRPVDLQRGTTMFASAWLVCINSRAASVVFWCAPSARVCTYVCTCILINTLLTPRPRHINHETMENAVGVDQQGWI